MPDNPPPVAAPLSNGESSAWHALPEHRLLQVEGRDAAAFLQAQCMNDVTALADSHWHWNGWLTPKGRVIALFALLRLDAQRFWLLLPDVAPAALAARLQGYVFRSKLSLQVRDDLHVGGRLAAPAQAAAARMGGDPAGAIELDFSGDGGDRSLCIGSAPVAGTPEFASRWAAFDLAHGLPRRLGAAGSEQWTPQQLSLQRLRAYSVSKGCYPGQEIVARTHFLGQAKRGLVLLEGDAPLAAGSEVRAGERPLGSVVSSAGQLALAVLALEREADTGLSVDGVPVHERPLQDGLAR